MLENRRQSQGNVLDIRSRSEMLHTAKRREFEWLKVVASAWVLMVALAVLDELTSLQHGAAALACAFTLLLGFALWSRFGRAVEASNGTSGANDRDRDQQTGLVNRQAFMSRLDEECHRVDRYGGMFSLVLVEMNNPAAVKREYGEAGWIEGLRHVGRCLDATKRLSDVTARYDDNTMAIILQTCDASGAKSFVERLEDRLARESVTVEVNGRRLSLWTGICAGSTSSLRRATDSKQMLANALNSLEAARLERDRRRQLWVNSA